MIPALLITRLISPVCSAPCVCSGYLTGRGVYMGYIHHTPPLSGAPYVYSHVSDREVMHYMVI
jgi:hypothetical protein